MENSTFTDIINSYSSYNKENAKALEAAPMLVKNGTEEQANEASWNLAMSMAKYTASSICKLGGVSDRAIESEDMLHDTIIRLATKANEFDPNLGFKFNTFAGKQVFNVLEKNKSGSSNGLNISKRRKENVASFKKAFVELTKEFGEEPTITEIAQYMGISEKAALDINQDRISMYSISLDASVDASEDCDDCLIDRIVTSDSTVSSVEAPVFEKSVRALVNQLPEMEREAFLFCNKVNPDFSFIEGKITRADIAKHMGVSVSKLARLYDHAVELLQEEAKKRSMTESLLGDEYIA